MADDPHFLGTGWRFPPSFDPHSRRLAMVAADDDIRDSLRILLSTTPGERVMQPAYGCNLRSLMFAPIDESTIATLRDLVRQAVLYFEARIDLLGIDVDTTNAEGGVLALRLEYTIRRTNSRSNVVYPFYFREGSNLPA